MLHRHPGAVLGHPWPWGPGGSASGDLDPTWRRGAEAWRRYGRCGTPNIIPPWQGSGPPYVGRGLGNWLPDATGTMWIARLTPIQISGPVRLSNHGEDDEDQQPDDQKRLHRIGIGNHELASGLHGIEGELPAG